MEISSYNDLFSSIGVTISIWTYRNSLLCYMTSEHVDTDDFAAQSVTVTTMDSLYIERYISSIGIDRFRMRRETTAGIVAAR
jgi:hypothetical protein